MTGPCAECGALPRGIGGSAGAHRPGCPGRPRADDDEAELALALRLLAYLEQLLAPIYPTRTETP